MPGDGSEVQTERIAGGPDSTNVVEVPAEKPSFKDQVLGYAKVTRGKVSIVSYARKICLLTYLFRLLAMYLILVSKQAVIINNY